MNKKFLQNAFRIEQAVLRAQLELSASSIKHPTVKGDVSEHYFLDFLRKYLPKRYVVDTGIIIDSNGDTSDQIDIVIFDNQYTPTLLDQEAHRYIPAEAVYCVLEVKQVINKENLYYAGGKARSVRSLHRTSIPITHAGGTFPAKTLFPIACGIVAAKSEWVGGLSSSAFETNLNELLVMGSDAVNFGLALDDQAFDTFAGNITYSGESESLMFFLFRLLQHLQSLATVPAVDWNKYAAVLSDTAS